MDASPDQAEQFEDGSATVIPLRGAPPPQNFPRPRTSFIGRRKELAELRQQLDTTRLLTLTGAGGCGKTRLAIQAASEARERFPDGVWWVELAPLAEEKLVGAAIAEALDVRPLPGMTPLQAACAYLASRRAMVILDNCEHLLRGSAEAAEALLDAAPDGVVLATSRAPLGVDGETEWRVPSLSLAGSHTPTRALDGSDAVLLFLARARDARPGFEVNDDNAEAVAMICEQIGGLPLAIELAAARVRILSVEQIADRVTDHFRLLTRGPATASPRQQTLRASVDWSHELLSPEEQVLMRRLGVFAGTFNLDAVERVCTSDGIESERALDLLSSLAEQSLVIAEEQGATMRYRLLETVRQYALEKLAAAKEEDEFRARHRDLFLALAEQADPHLWTGRMREWLEILDPEAANLAAAIDYALSSDPALALRICGALWPWWRARGRIAEAELAHSRSLDACPDREPGLRARVQLGSAFIDIIGAQVEEAQAHATEALALAEEVGDLSTAARARCEIADAIQFGKPAAARAELARAAELAEAAGDDWARVQAEQIVALTYMLQADHAQSARANDKVTALAERLGVPYQVARRWYFTGWMAIVDGRFTDAREACARTHEAVEGVGEPVWETNADIGLELIRIWEGEGERAHDRLQEVLARAIRLGLGMLVPMVLASLARAELATGRFEEARERSEGLVGLVQGRASSLTALALGQLAESQRLLGDDAAESNALEAQAAGEQCGNRLWATCARLTLGRLAAARDQWSTAQQHALAHLDVCVEDGHATYAPACLDALAEVAAGVQANEDAARLLAAAERARAEIGMVRFPPEAEHWRAIDAGLKDALGDDAYAAARAEGAELTLEDALEWARRARGPRQRPAGGWESLTPTESKVVALVAEGLTNPQVGERMFISPATVKTHLSHIFGKLDVHSRAELTAYAVRQGKPAS